MWGIYEVNQKQHISILNTESAELQLGIPPPGLVFQPRGSGFCDVKPRGPRGPVYTGPVNTEY